MDRKKPAVQSFGFWGGLTGIVSTAAFIREIIANNPELVDDSRAWLIAASILGSQLIALIGRWKAVSQISGLLFTRK